MCCWMVYAYYYIKSFTNQIPFTINTVEKGTNLIFNLRRGRGVGAGFF